MEDFKPYIVELEQEETMKPKIYPNDCAIKGPNWQPVIVIIHDEFIFSANDEFWQV